MPVSEVTVPDWARKALVCTAFSITAFAGFEAAAAVIGLDALPGAEVWGHKVSVLGVGAALATALTYLAFRAPSSELDGMAGGLREMAIGMAVLQINGYPDVLDARARRRPEATWEEWKEAWLTRPDMFTPGCAAIMRRLEARFADS